MTASKALVAALLASLSPWTIGCDWTSLDALGMAIEAEDAGATDATDLDASRATNARDSSFMDAGPDQDTSIPTPCGPEKVVQEWTFDVSVEGWTISAETNVDAGLTWTSAMGNPSPGALEVSVTPRKSDAGVTSGAWPQYDVTLGDLSNRTISAWVWLESGPSPELKLFVQTGTQFVWADNGTVRPSPEAWTCVSLPVSSPSYNQEDYDPTDVVRLGFQLFGAEPFRVYIDTVRIY
jgi:hypothetical protein